MWDVIVLARREPKAAKPWSPGPPEVGPASRICDKPGEGWVTALLRAVDRQLPYDSLLSFRLLSRVHLHLQHLLGEGCRISPPSQLDTLPRKGFIPDTRSKPPPPKYISCCLFSFCLFKSASI